MHDDKLKDAADKAKRFIIQKRKFEKTFKDTFTKNIE
jgi:hypothetical protein